MGVVQNSKLELRLPGNFHLTEPPMKTLITILATVIIVPACFGDPGAFREPGRVVNNHVVNIAPLFHWWTNAEAIGRIGGSIKNKPKIPERPLGAWIKISGDKITITGMGWVVDGAIEETPGKVKALKYILRHEPTNERRLFNAAIAEWNDVMLRRTNAAIAAASPKGSGSDEQLQAPGRVLSVFKNKRFYEIDHFAMRTGEFYKGLPILDLGLVNH